MKTVNSHEAKAHLSQPVKKAMAGDTTVSGDAEKSHVVLMPYAAPVERRHGGQLRSQIVEAAGCWSTDELTGTVAT